MSEFDYQPTTSQVDPATYEAEQTRIGRVMDFVRGRMDQMDERGSMLIPMGASIARRHKILSGCVAAAGIMSLAVACEASASFSATTDLNKADTSATLYDFAWGKGDGIATPNLYFMERESAQDMTYDINAVVCTPVVHVCKDLFPPFMNPKVNKQLDGAGQETLKIPFEAIKAKESNDKLDVTVDWSKITGFISWVGSGATVQNYTLDGNTRNFSDQQGFRNSLLNSNAQALRVINMDKLGNTLDGLDDKVAHDMRQRGLDAMTTCNQDTKLQKQMKIKFADSVKNAIKALNDAPEVNSVKFINVAEGIQTDTGQEAAAVLGSNAYDQSKYVLASGKFGLDNLNCNVSESEANQPAPAA